ncbi:hypothetical protein HUB98_18110 [Paenibacillus barcinonensis]|uniref:Uncharacterized protein n=1 Tax=Paenibacillus barcinonensis TaxID=198119 RepID=A0A2V4UWV8_PAEBA|nr:hypothetical protein [Paenibacillus barcinonensis]PYE44553.1 hypothetical protein DFQ00_12171 [Paenibacillus barcinonensis]QKS58010.1 hypothetical protein HUB98_18110 [Paenibacillus barcinonensis]
MNQTLEIKEAAKQRHNGLRPFVVLHLVMLRFDALRPCLQVSIMALNNEL